MLKNYKDLKVKILKNYSSEIERMLKAQIKSLRTDT